MRSPSGPPNQNSLLIVFASHHIPPSLHNYLAAVLSGTFLKRCVSRSRVSADNFLRSISCFRTLSIPSDSEPSMIMNAKNAETSDTNNTDSGPPQPPPAYNPHSESPGPDPQAPGSPTHVQTPSPQPEAFTGPEQQPMQYPPAAAPGQKSAAEIGEQYRAERMCP